nr:unnamed protein product [Callosobruchus chinensis]
MEVVFKRENIRYYHHKYTPRQYKHTAEYRGKYFPKPLLKIPVTVPKTALLTKKLSTDDAMLTKVFGNLSGLTKIVEQREHLWNGTCLVDKSRIDWTRFLPADVSRITSIFAITACMDTPSNRVKAVIISLYFLLQALFKRMLKDVEIIVTVQMLVYIKMLYRFTGNLIRACRFDIVALRWESLSCLFDFRESLMVFGIVFIENTNREQNLNEEFTPHKPCTICTCACTVGQSQQIYSYPALMDFKHVSNLGVMHCPACVFDHGITHSMFTTETSLRKDAMQNDPPIIFSMATHRRLSPMGLKIHNSVKDSSLNMSGRKAFMFDGCEPIIIDWCIIEHERDDSQTQSDLKLQIFVGQSCDMSSVSNLQQQHQLLEQQQQRSLFAMLMTHFQEATRRVIVRMPVFVTRAATSRSALSFVSPAPDTSVSPAPLSGGRPCRVAAAL